MRLSIRCYRKSDLKAVSVLFLLLRSMRYTTRGFPRIFMNRRQQGQRQQRRRQEQDSCLLQSQPQESNQLEDTAWSLDRTSESENRGLRCKRKFKSLSFSYGLTTSDIVTDIATSISTNTPVLEEEMDEDKESECPPDQQRLLSLLKDWLGHCSTDYHSFTQGETNNLRACLLKWYGSHRRKLPWRGDPPPFDGNSTTKKSDHESKQRKKTNNKKTTRKDKGDNACISSFSTTTVDTTIDQLRENRCDNLNDITTVQDGAIPITAYGVWVSEIMLQQTRVESVIPYWIRCKLNLPRVDCACDMNIHLTTYVYGND